MNREKLLLLWTGLVIFIGLFGMGSFFSAWAAEYCVMIDPGHGGQEQGIELSRSVTEAAVVLSIGKRIEEILSPKKAIKVVLTRSDDRSVAVKDRKKAAQSAKADLYVSLHVNAGFGTKSLGYEVYFRGFDSTKSEKHTSKNVVNDMIETRCLNDSIRFSNIVQRELGKVFVRQGRGLRGAPVAVLQDIEMPAVLIELGFATNVKNRTMLLEKDTQKNIAKAISKSIEEYFSSAGSL